jgi:uncharacterized protein (TIGR03083 family)
MADPLDYLDHLSRESRRFVGALASAGAATRVPSCPDWDADDLLWHLAEVQWFWGTIVRDRLQNPAAAEEAKPPRPTGRESLLGFFEEASSGLSQVLADTAPDTEVWTWSADHSVSFIRRRQAHEALIHRVDAELTTGFRTPMDPPLSADGVDEALRVMYGGLPSWGSFTADDAKTVRLQATDTGDSWFVRLGRFTGTDPESETSYDEPDLHPDDADPGSPAAATISGSAADLDCWLWHRAAFAPLERSGAEPVLAALDSILSPGIN